MAIQFPRVLKNLNLFVDGQGYAGRIDEITLPKLTIQTEEHRGGGMDLPVELDMGMAALTGQATVSDIDPALFASFGLLSSEGQPITVRGGTQAQGNPAVTPVTVNMRGSWKEIDFGGWKPGAKAPLTLAYTLTYYKLTIDGTELIEIDAINMIRKINGTDQLEAMRTALGM